MLLLKGRFGASLAQELERALGLAAEHPGSLRLRATPPRVDPTPVENWHGIHVSYGFCDRPCVVTGLRGQCSNIAYATWTFPATKEQAAHCREVRTDEARIVAVDSRFQLIVPSPLLTLLLRHSNI